MKIKAMFLAHREPFTQDPNFRNADYTETDLYCTEGKFHFMWNNNRGREWYAVEPCDCGERVSEVEATDELQEAIDKFLQIGKMSSVVVRGNNIGKWREKESGG